jgi:hypothetical protein
MEKKQGKAGTIIKKNNLGSSQQVDMIQNYCKKQTKNSKDTKGLSNNTLSLEGEGWGEGVIP